MKRKIFAFLIVLTFSICLTSIAFAENSSLDDVKSADVDDSNYIKIVSVSNGEIKFSDGFTGYALDYPSPPWKRVTHSHMDSQAAVKLKIMSNWQ